MRTSLYLKILIGCFVALTAVATILGTVIVAYAPFLQNHLLTAITLFAAAGLGMVLFGNRAAAGNDVTRKQSEEQQPSEDMEHPLAFFRKLTFWGCIIAVSSLPIYIWSLGRMRGGHGAKPSIVKKIVAAPAPKPEPKVVSPVPEPVAMSKVEFPVMLLRGILWNGTKSTAVINDRTLRAGDSLDGVKVLSINSNSVTVGKGSLTVLLKLE